MVLLRVGRRWSIDVCSASEEDVRLDVDEVRTTTPDIFSVINDGHHLIPTRKDRSRVEEQEYTQIYSTNRGTVLAVTGTTKADKSIVVVIIWYMFTIYPFIPMASLVRQGLN